MTRPPGCTCPDTLDFSSLAAAEATVAACLRCPHVDEVTARGIKRSLRKRRRKQ